MINRDRHEFFNLDNLVGKSTQIVFKIVFFNVKSHMEKKTVSKVHFPLINLTLKIGCFVQGKVNKKCPFNNS